MKMLTLWDMLRTVYPDLPEQVWDVKVYAPISIDDPPQIIVAIWPTKMDYRRFIFTITAGTWREEVN